MKKYNWYRVAGNEKEIAFGANHLAVVQVNGKTIALGNYKSRLFAFAHKCPHAGGILAEGWIDSRGNVVCPVHGYRFNIENGRNMSGEGYTIRHWPVESREDGVFVGLEEELPD